MAESPSLLFKSNLGEVTQLMKMHAALAGSGRGRKHKVEVLNKSAILFACAAFEAFIEDLAKRSFDHLVLKSNDHTKIPRDILKSIAISLREDRNEMRVWDIAGDGWKTTAEHHKQNLISKYIGPFNTPKPGNIESLLKKLTGFPDTYPVWTWQGMSETASKNKLREFVELRGALAHGSKPQRPVLMKNVRAYVKFLAAFSVRLSNDMRSYCIDLTNEAPWPSVHYGAIK